MPLLSFSLVVNEHLLSRNRLTNAASRRGEQSVASTDTNEHAEQSSEDYYEEEGEPDELCGVVLRFGDDLNPVRVMLGAVQQLKVRGLMSDETCCPRPFSIHSPVTSELIESWCADVAPKS